MKGLGDVLVEQGIIDATSLHDALALQQEKNISLGKALIESGAASESEIVSAMAKHLGMAFHECSGATIDVDAALLVPKALAQETMALPVAFAADGSLVVAVADPRNAEALERIASVTGQRVTPALAVRTAIQRAIDHLPYDESDLGPVAAQPATAAPAAPAAAAPVAVVNEEASGGLLAFEQDTKFDLDAILMELVDRNGSDLHLTAGVPPTIRVHGELEPLQGHPVLVPDELRKMLYGILTQKQRERFENDLELDLSYTVPGKARFRVNVFQQRDSLGAVMRVIPFEIKQIDELGVPAQVANFAYLPRGFVLVTGPTGSGKSTTLASLIDVINRERASHIMTVEDPIEFLHKHKRSLVNQRELGTDTHSFAEALKHVLRQDPDVILVGEMRDLETIQVALTAAETGHLVFGTLHTQDAPQTVDRVIDVFPPHQQEQIRVMLAGALQGVVCQQLLKRADGQGRVAACEVMIATAAIRNLIREGKTHQMYSSIQAGKQHGMVTMDQSLATLVLTGKVSYQAALERCNNPSDFNRLCGRA